MSASGEIKKGLCFSFSEKHSPHFLFSTRKTLRFLVCILKTKASRFTVLMPLDFLIWNCDFMVTSSKISVLKKF